MIDIGLVVDYAMRLLTKVATIVVGVVDAMVGWTMEALKSTVQS